MGRFDFNFGEFAFFDYVEAQFNVIPENRPTVFGPGFPTVAAPYSLAIPGFEILQNDRSSGINDMQFAFRLSLVVDRWQFFARTGHFF